MRRKNTGLSDQLVVEVCDQLQANDLPSIFAAKEVLGWLQGSTFMIALRGDALRIERGVILGGPENPGMMNNRDYMLDVRIQKIAGLDAHVEYQGYRAVGVRGGIGQRLDSDSTHFSEVLRALGEAIGTGTGMDEDVGMVHVTLMPSEGEPWDGEGETHYYNAKKRKWFVSAPPSWAVEVYLSPSSVEERSETTALGADFCQLMPVLGHEGHEYLSAVVNDQPFIVTHSMDFGHRGRWTKTGEIETVTWQVAADYINACGGLIFPSLAVAPIPASSFGLVSLVFDPSLVLQGLKPYAGKGRWPIVVYTSDVWTETTSVFIGKASVELAAQLTGQWTPNIYRGEHMYILGPLAELGEDSPSEGRPVHDTKKLAGSLKKRGKIWQRGFTKDEIDDIVMRSPPEARYPYLEAKANGVVSINAISGCVCPDFLADDTEAFLRAIGFGGELIVLPVSDEDQPELLGVTKVGPGMKSDATFEWSWRVHDAVMERGKMLKVRT